MIKTEGVNGGHGALLNVHELQHKVKTTAVKGNSDWKKVELVFESTQSGPLTINCLFGGWGQAKGTAWYDDLSLQEVKPIYAQAEGQKEIKGLADRGKEIFHKHAVASCVRCHKIGNEGGVIGPALDGIASRKDRAYLYESLVDPTATLAEGFDKLGASPMPPMNLLLNDQRGKGNQCRHQHHHNADAIHAHVIVNVQRRNPFHTLGEFITILVLQC